MASSVFVAGIDEAGYAPKLGPLVVTGVRLERPAGGDDLYALLAPAVSRPPRAARAAEAGEAPIVVADSKKVHDPSKGPAALERGVLPFMAAALGGSGAGDGLTDLGLAAALTGGGPDRSGLEWYGGAPESLPVAADPEDVARSCFRLAEALELARIGGLAIRSRVVTARELNAAFARGLNKAEFLVEVVAGLMAPLAGALAARRRDGDRAPNDDASLLVDRLGGRKDYRALLTAAFPGAATRELARRQRESGYAVEGPGGAWRLAVSFACGAEDACMTVALASMVSKYLRELFMRRLNRWFAERVPGLRATAGYPVDAGRFLRDTAAFRERAGIEDGLLVRER